MDYNYEFQRIKEEALRHGYEFTGEKFERTKQNEFPVMEMTLIDNSTYEESGDYYIFKKTMRIDREEFEKIVKYAHENEFREFYLKNPKDNRDFCESVFGCIDLKYNRSNIDFIIDKTDGRVMLEYREHDNCVNLWLRKDDTDCDFPIGYLSFYEMNSADFFDAEEVSLQMMKYKRG